MDTLKRRDVKGLYAGAASGKIKNVVGVDIEFPKPKAPDLTIDDLQQDEGVEACLSTIMKQIPSLD